MVWRNRIRAAEFGHPVWHADAKLGLGFLIFASTRCWLGSDNGIDDVIARRRRQMCHCQKRRRSGNSDGLPGCELFIQQRTQLINALRGHCTEFRVIGDQRSPRCNGLRDRPLCRNRMAKKRADIWGLHIFCPCYRRCPALTKATRWICRDGETENKTRQSGPSSRIRFLGLEAWGLIRSKRRRARPVQSRKTQRTRQSQSTAPRAACPYPSKRQCHDAADNHPEAEKGHDGEEHPNRPAHQ